jgi:hypothetical protein
VATPSSSGAAAIAAVPAQSVSVAMKNDVEHGKKGPDGKWHDAALPANFSVRAGARVTVTLTNYDTPHTFTAPGLGVNAVMPGGTANAPTVTKVTFTAPKTPGPYMWHCSIPCDPWSMMRMGYMMGTVTVKA